MEIEELVTRLAQIPGAVVGHGPRHPLQPDRSIESEVQSFLDSYPSARRDRGYVDFLEMYSGAIIESEGDSILVDVLGFNEVSSSMAELDGPAVEDGFLTFAMCVYHEYRDERLDTYEYDFAFDVSGSRKPGVYRCFSTAHQLDQPLIWHTDDFCSWLAELVAKGGVYERSVVD